ncbi:unnamed protein product, partial [Allacma fusca]
TEFQQIVTLSDSSLLQLKDSIIINDSSVMATSVSAIREQRSFTENFDSPCTLTAVIIHERNESLLLQRLKSILIFPTSEIATDLEKFMLTSVSIIIWPTVLSERSEEEFVKTLERSHFSVPLDADVFIATENTEHVTSLWEAYSIKGIQIVEKVRENVSVPYLLWDMVKSKWKRRNNFRGATIIATGTHDPIYEPEVNFTIHSNGTAELENGMAVYVYRTFRDFLNFTEAAIVGQYIGENSTDMKVLGMEIYLRRGDADLAITQSGVTDEKSAVVTLLHATTANWLEAKFSHEPSSTWKFFISPFDTNLWTLVVLHVIVMVACATLYRKAIPNEDDLEPTEPCQTWWICIQLDFIWALGTICQQGWYDWPRKTPLRILFLVASVTGFLLNAAYSGTITSQLSVKDPIRLTFEKLINLSFIFFMENDFSFPVDPEKYPKRIQITTLYDLNDSSSAVTNLFKVKSALISYPEFFYSVIQHVKITDADACDQFTAIRVSKTPNLCSMAVKKGSPLKEVLNVKILFMWERGTLPRLNADYKSKTQLRCEYDNHVLDPQTIGELFMAYLIIIIGITASAGFLLVEILLEILKQSHMLGRPDQARPRQSVDNYVNTLQEMFAPNNF